MTKRLNPTVAVTWAKLDHDDEIDPNHTRSKPRASIRGSTTADAVMTIMEKPSMRQPRNRREAVRKKNEHVGESFIETTRTPSGPS